MGSFYGWIVILTLSADSWGKQPGVDFFAENRGSHVGCMCIAHMLSMMLVAMISLELLCIYYILCASFAHDVRVSSSFFMIPSILLCCCGIAVKGNKGGSFARLILKRRDSREPKRDIEPQHHTRIERRQHASSISSPKFPSNIPTT